MRILYLMAVSCLLCWSAPAAVAQGLAQLSFSGVAQQHGALLELELQYLTPTQEQRSFATVDVSMYVAPGSTGRDVAHVVSQTLVARGLKSMYSGVDSGTGGVSSRRGELFVEGITALRVRIGSGLTVVVSACNAAPKLVRLTRPASCQSATQLTVNAIGRSAVDGAISSGQLTCSVAGGATGPMLTNALLDAAIKQGWTCDRPKPDAWRPKTVSPAVPVVGCSISVQSVEPWWLEVVFLDS